MMSTGRLYLLMVIALVVLPVRTVRAQSGPSPDPSLTLNYAFATQLGSGIYRVNDRTVQIYRISASFSLLDSIRGSWELRLRIPVTLGFYDFKIEDVIDDGLPDNLGTLAIVPAVELGIPLNKEWTLEPFAAFGGGRDFSGGGFNFIYAAGINTLAKWPWGNQVIRLGNRLVYSGYTNSDLDFVDDFAAFETGVDLRRGLGFDIRQYEVDASVFVANYLYFLSPRLVRLIPEPVEMRTEWELGVTLGTVDLWRILGIGLPRLGLSYRFGSGHDAVRIIIGNPFPMYPVRERGAAVD